MTKSIYPKTIRNMILNGVAKGLTTQEITDKVNSSRTASKLRVNYSHRSIATAIGNITRVQ